MWSGAGPRLLLILGCPVDHPSFDALLCQGPANWSALLSSTEAWLRNPHWGNIARQAEVSSVFLPPQARGEEFLRTLVPQ